LANSDECQPQRRAGSAKVFASFFKKKDFLPTQEPPQ
jgi:hypothetical protein